MHALYTYSAEVMVLKRDDLLEVAREFEQADRQLRRAGKMLFFSG